MGAEKDTLTPLKEMMARTGTSPYVIGTTVVETTSQQVRRIVREELRAQAHADALREDARRERDRPLWEDAKRRFDAWGDRLAAQCRVERGVDGG
jgi:hypothetical protein